MKVFVSFEMVYKTFAVEMSYSLCCSATVRIIHRYHHLCYTDFVIEVNLYRPPSLSFKAYFCSIRGTNLIAAFGGDVMSCD